MKYTACVNLLRLPTATTASHTFGPPRITPCVVSCDEVLSFLQSPPACPIPARAPMSVLAGGDAEDQCECASGALGDVGECGE